MLLILFITNTFHDFTIINEKLPMYKMFIYKLNLLNISFSLERGCLMWEEKKTLSKSMLNCCVLLLERAVCLCTHCGLEQVSVKRSRMLKTVPLLSFYMQSNCNHLHYIF